MAMANHEVGGEGPAAKKERLEKEAAAEAEAKAAAAELEKHVAADSKKTK